MEEQLLLRIVASYVWIGIVDRLFSAYTASFSFVRILPFSSCSIRVLGNVSVYDAGHKEFVLAWVDIFDCHVYLMFSLQGIYIYQSTKVISEDQTPIIVHYRSIMRR